jgi:hypothetical protein
MNVLFMRIDQHAIGQSCEMEEYVDNTQKTLEKTYVENGNVGQIQ